MTYLTLRRSKQEMNKELSHFIGIVNDDREIWFYRSELPARFHWLDSHQARSSLNGTHPINRPSIKIKKWIETKIQVLIYYPDFNKHFRFHPYTDASDYQLGAVIMQDEKQNNYSLLFAKAQYSSKAVYNHWKWHRVVISYWNLQGIQEYPIRYQ
jgi:hypothetical protein